MKGFFGSELKLLSDVTPGECFAWQRRTARVYGLKVARKHDQRENHWMACLWSSNPAELAAGSLVGFHRPNAVTVETVPSARIVCSQDPEHRLFKTTHEGNPGALFFNDRRLFFTWRDYDGGVFGYAEIETGKEVVNLPSQAGWVEILKWWVESTLFDEDKGPYERLFERSGNR